MRWQRVGGPSPRSLCAIRHALASLFPDGRVVRCLLPWPPGRWSGFAVVLPGGRVTIAFERSLIADAEPQDVAHALRKAGVVEARDAGLDAFFVVRRRRAGDRFGLGWLLARRLAQREPPRLPSAGAHGASAVDAFHRHPSP